jgi:hypothetical protein
MPAKPHWSTRYCVLCGAQFSPFTLATSPPHIEPVKDFHSFLLSRCTQTQWHFTSLIALCENSPTPTDPTDPTQQTVSMCSRCFQWRRRTSARNTLSKCFTPFDSVLLYALSPGETTKPDRRTLSRLITEMSSDTNAFHSIVPAPVRTILSRADEAKQDGGTYEAVEDALLLQWYEENERPTFFRSGATAKCFRHMFKRSTQS